MDLKITFEPFAADTPDLFMSVRDDQIEDARAVAKTTAEANFPIALGFTIMDAGGVPLERWEVVDGLGRLHREDNGAHVRQQWEWTRSSVASSRMIWR